MAPIADAFPVDLGSERPSKRLEEWPMHGQVLKLILSPLLEHRIIAHNLQSLLGHVARAY